MNRLAEGQAEGRIVLTLRKEPGMANTMRLALIAIAVVAAGAVAAAHVTVVPRESQAGATERYTIRVPTEGQVATTAVELEVPSGVTVTEVVAGNAYSFEARREGDRITAIIWKQEIPPGSRADFVFVARNPAAGPLRWKAHQRFADGTSADWVGVEGDRRPASATTLTAR
jgi:uncharacterized protein YcnI